MDPTVDKFKARLDHVMDRHRRINAGVVYKMDRTGLIRGFPADRRQKFPVAGLALIIAAGLLFKAFIYVDIGAGNYADKIAVFAGDNIATRIGAWVLQADPATVFIAGIIGKFTG
jgi:hypothetical protein